MSSSTESGARKPFWILAILCVLFGIPLLLASWMAGRDQPLVTHTTNRGQLIQPPLAMAKLDLPSDQQGWKGHWLLLYISPTTCDATCEKMLYNIRQIRTATGKDSERVTRAILTFTDKSADPHLQQLLAHDFDGTMHLTASQPTVATLLKGSTAEKVTMQQGSIYLVDPLGNILMFYSVDAAPMGIFKDLSRLLKISQIG